MKKYLIVLLVVLSLPAYSQEPCELVSPINEDDYPLEFFPSTIEGTVDFSHSGVGNTRNILIDWNSVTLNQYGSYSEVNIKGYVMLLLAHNYLQNEIGSCEGTFTLNFVDMKECSYSEYCYFRVNSTSEILCSDDWVGDLPERFTHTNNQRMIRVKAGEGTCGYICCVTPVTIDCEDITSIAGNMDLQIGSPYIIFNNCFTPEEENCLTEEPYECNTPTCNLIGG